MNEFLRSRLALLMSAALVLFFVSCSDKDSANLTSDEEAIQKEILADADSLFSLDIMGEHDPTGISKTMTSDGVELAKVSTPIPEDQLKGYGRRVKISRTGITVVVAPDSQSAEATVHYKMVGKFVLATKADSASSTVLYLKSMEHPMVRKIRFVRNTDLDARRKWLVSEVSMGFGVSTGGTMSLGSVSVTITGDSDQTYTTTDPVNQFFSRTALPIIKPGDVVTITLAVANSNASDTPIGTMHRGAKSPQRTRFKNYFTNNNDGTYTFQWTVPVGDFAGVHIGVMDFFATSTLYDTDAAYNSLVVTMPYVKGGQLPGHGN